MRSFVKIKSSRNAEITLSFTDIGKSCPSGEFLVLQICVLTLIAKIKFSRKFLDLQYQPCTTFQGGAAFVDPVCYLCFVFFFVTLSCLFFVALWSPAAKRLALGSLVRGVFLPVFHFPKQCPGSGVVLDCIDSLFLPSSFLCHAYETPFSTYEDTEGLDEHTHMQRTNHDLPSTSL